MRPRFILKHPAAVNGFGHDDNPPLAPIAYGTVEDETMVLVSRLLQRLGCWAITAVGLYGLGWLLGWAPPLIACFAALPVLRGVIWSVSEWPAEDLD